MLCKPLIAIEAVAQRAAAIAAPTITREPIVEGLVAAARVLRTGLTAR